MTTPKYEELLEGFTQWRKIHKGVTYLLSHHGYVPEKQRSNSYFENHQGIWCYYLLIPEQMYPHRWSGFECVRNASGFETHGNEWDLVEFDSEITWASSEPYWCRKTSKLWDLSKVGCDYAHLWHQEQGFIDTYQSVNRDAIKTVESFLKNNPDFFVRCRDTGIWQKQSDNERKT